MGLGVEEEEENGEVVARDINDAVRGIRSWVWLQRGFTKLEVVENLRN